MTEFWEKVFDALAVVAVIGLDRLITYIKGKKKAKAKANAVGLENNMEIDRQVRHVEVKFIHAMKPIRIFVMHFHNGTFTDAGVSLQKLVIKHELIPNRNTMPMSATHHSVAIPDFLQPTLSNISFYGESMLNDREDVVKKNPDFYNWLRYYDVVSQYCTAVRSNVTKKIVAVLVLQFDRVHPLLEDDLIHINEQKKRIEDIYDKLPNISDTELT